MGKNLRDILIDRMVGDMSKIFTLKNALKPPEELIKLTMPKIEATEADIRGLFSNLIKQSKEQIAPLTWLEKEVNKL